GKIELRPPPWRERVSPPRGRVRLGVGQETFFLGSHEDRQAVAAGEDAALGPALKTFGGLLEAGEARWTGPRLEVHRRPSRRAEHVSAPDLQVGTSRHDETLDDRNAPDSQD